MIKPLPEQFGLNEEDIKYLEKKLEEINSQFNPTTKGYSNISAFIANVVIWGSYFLISNAPKLTQLTFLEIAGHLLFVYMATLALIKLSSLIIQYHLSIYNKNRFPVLNKLYNAPLLNKFYQFRESWINYEQWFNDKKLEFQNELEKWKQINGKTKESFWLALDGLEFERELASVYSDLNYKVSLTRQTSDGGVDIHLSKDSKNTVVQCKAHKKPVGVKVVRELFGVMHHFGADEAVVASTSGFTKDANVFAKGKPIRLIDLNDILNLQFAALKNTPVPFLLQNSDVELEVKSFRLMFEIFDKVLVRVNFLGISPYQRFLIFSNQNLWSFLIPTLFVVLLFLPLTNFNAILESISKQQQTSSKLENSNKNSNELPELENLLTPMKELSSTNPTVNAVTIGSEKVIQGHVSEEKAFEILYGNYDLKLKGSIWKPTKEELLQFDKVSRFSKEDTFFVTAVSVKDNGDKWFLVTAAIPLEYDSEYDCHACAPIMGAAVFKKNKDIWEMEIEQKYIAEIGYYGIVPNVALVKIGQENYGFLLELRDFGQGYTYEGIILIAKLGSTFKKILEIETGGNNAGVCSNALENCWKFSSKYKFVSMEKDRFSDFKIETTGTKKKQEEIISINEAKIYRFTGTEYKLSLTLNNLSSVTRPRRVHQSN